MHNVTATKNGDRAAIAWATMRHLGREGYRESVRRVLMLREFIVNSIEAIEGIRMLVKSQIIVVHFTSDVYDVEKIYQEMLSRGWGTSYWVKRGIRSMWLSIHPNRDMEHAKKFLKALEDSVDAVKTRMQRGQGCGSGTTGVQERKAKQEYLSTNPVIPDRLKARATFKALRIALRRNLYVFS